MGDIGEFSFSVRTFLRTYRWRTNDPVPWSPLRKRVSQSRLALVTTAGLIAPGQLPFDSKVKGGDPTYRVIPTDRDVTSLIDTHRSETFDHSGICADANLAFPLDRLRELAAEKRIGSLTSNQISFMGSITATKRLTSDTAPSAARLLVDEGAEAALLVPV